MDFHSKYLKYKKKYLELKSTLNQKGGFNNLNDDCPISLEPLRNGQPVCKTNVGSYYHCDSILANIQAGNTTDPQTRQPLTWVREVPANFLQNNQGPQIPDNQLGNQRWPVPPGAIAPPAAPPVAPPLPAGVGNLQNPTMLLAQGADSNTILNAAQQAANMATQIVNNNIAAGIPVANIQEPPLPPLNSVWSNGRWAPNQWDQDTNLPGTNPPVEDPRFNMPAVQ